MYGVGFTDKLQQVLIAIESSQLLSAFPRSALIPAKNSDFEAIHALALKLDFIR
jgi:phosphonate transport system substrate-binding protein